MNRSSVIDYCEVNYNAESRKIHSNRRFRDDPDLIDDAEMTLSDSAFWNFAATTRTARMLIVDSSKDGTTNSLAAIAR